MTGSKSAGRLALAISAIYPFFIYYSGMLMSEPLYLLFVTGGLWALCASIKKRRSPLCRIGGFLLALAA